MGTLSSPTSPSVAVTSLPALPAGTNIIGAISNVPAPAALADAAVNPSTTLVGSLGEVFNGTTWDRARANMDVALLTGVTATATQNSADQVNVNGRGVKVVLDVTSAGTGSITLTVQGKDFSSVKYYPLLTGVAVTTVSTNVYEVYPGVTATANVWQLRHCPGFGVC